MKLTIQIAAGILLAGLVIIVFGVFAQESSSHKRSMEICVNQYHTSDIKTCTVIMQQELKVLDQQVNK